jgi:hypothetical protein
MAKVYILTETDLNNLQTKMEIWEVEMRNRYENAKISNRPEGEILSHIRYNLVGWINEVKR